MSYFNQYHEGKEIGYWFTICAIAGGSVGVFLGKVGRQFSCKFYLQIPSLIIETFHFYVGGYISDLVVTRLGLHSRLWLLGICTVI